jgi:hypothetical protein
LLTAISRAEKATFIIGSAELLRENEHWNKLLNIAIKEENFVIEPPLPAETVRIRKVIGKRRQISAPSDENDSDELHSKRRRIIIEPQQNELSYEEEDDYDDEDGQPMILQHRKIRRMQRTERQKANRRNGKQHRQIQHQQHEIIYL